MGKPGTSRRGSPRSLGLALLATVVVAAVLALVWTLRVSQRPAPGTVESGPEASRNPAVRTQPVGTMTAVLADDETRSLSVRPDGTGSPQHEPPREERSGLVTPLAELLIAASDQLERTAEKCVGESSIGSSNLGGVVFQCTLVFENESVRVEDVILIDSDLDDDNLQRCILDRVRTATWRAPGARNARKRVQETISVADLGGKPAAADPPEGEGG